MDESQEVTRKRLCVECLGEPFLREQIQKDGLEGVCSYCGNEGKTIALEDLADAVETAIKEHFYRTATEPSGYEYALIKDGDRDWYREGERVADVIASIAEIDAEVAEDIREVLEERHYDIEDARMGEECPFESDAHYAESGVSDGEIQSEWAYFESSLKTKARYFSRISATTLHSVFDGIGTHATSDGRPVILKAGPGEGLSALFRARVFQADHKLKHALEEPDVELGPPPAPSAAAGRMNALGISVFYGATDPTIAIAEVRPPVGSKVLVGRFEITRPLSLLDVEALRSVYVQGSVFDREFIHRLRHAKFLEGLSRRITKPVMPDDQPFEYLPTQAIADFLATEADPALDGIVYPSVQGPEGKLNVVLFHKSARVERLEIPKGTRLSSRFSFGSDDDEDVDYRVWEEVPPIKSEVPPVASGLDLGPHSPILVPFDFLEEADYDDRTITLKLDISSLEVHHVAGVTFFSEPHQVHRHRIEKRPTPF